MDLSIITIQSCTATIICHSTPLLQLLGVVRTDSDIKGDKIDHAVNNYSTPLFRKVQLVAISLSTEGSAPIMARSGQLIYLVLHPNLEYSQVVLPFSETLRILSGVLVSIWMANSEVKAKTLLNTMLVVLESDKLHVIVHLENAADIAHEQRDGKKIGLSYSTLYLFTKEEKSGQTG